MIVGRLMPEFWNGKLQGGNQIISYDVATWADHKICFLAQHSKINSVETAWAEYEECVK